MKKYGKLIPLILYPYLWTIGVAIVLWMESTEIAVQDTLLAYLPHACILLVAVFLLYCLCISIFSAMLQEAYSPTEAASLNMVVKLLHIPAYVLNFVVGVIGIPMVVLYGLGILIIQAMIIIDVSAIVFTGIQAIGTTSNLYNNQVINKVWRIFFSIMSFLFCVDVIIAVVMYIQAVSLERKKLE